MKIIAKREAILGPLQAVIGVVERRQTMPILANVLLSAKGERLAVTATDLEVELVATSEVDVQRAGEVTVPGRKLLDICRALPEGVEMTLNLEGERMVVRARKSRFTLSTLPATEFPTVEEINAQQTLKLPQKDFKRLLDKTHFSMAQQDVRYYLNGLLLETSSKSLRSVATDGHRLALCEVDQPDWGKAGQQVIVPRKGVLELQRILGNEDQMLEVGIGSNHVRVQIGDIRFTSKLIDGRFPEYGRVIPNQPPLLVTAVRDDLRQSLQRAAILSNGSKGKTRLAQLLMGSNTARVIGLSPVDVLVVPKDATLGLSRLLVASDGSPFSDAAFTMALALAKRLESALFGLSVAREEGQLQAAQAATQQMLSQANRQGVPMEDRVRVGAPDDAIVQTALDTQAELIILGTHGKTGLTRLLMGSTTERVIGRSPIPVLVVKRGED